MSVGQFARLCPDSRHVAELLRDCSRQQAWNRASRDVLVRFFGESRFRCSACHERRAQGHSRRRPRVITSIATALLCCSARSLDVTVGLAHCQYRHAQRGLAWAGNRAQSGKWHRRSREHEQSSSFCSNVWSLAGPVASEIHEPAGGESDSRPLLKHCI